MYRKLAKLACQVTHYLYLFLPVCRFAKIGEACVQVPPVRTFAHFR